MATVPRNVIWITTDHMRFDNIAAHGNPAMVTPNLDRLVKGTGDIGLSNISTPLHISESPITEMQIRQVRDDHCVSGPAVWSASGLRTHP